MTLQPSPLNPNPQSSFQNQVTPVQIPAPKVSWRLKKLPFLILDAVIVFGIIALCIFAFVQNKDLRGKNSKLGETKRVLQKEKSNHAGTIKDLETKKKSLTTATNALKVAKGGIAVLEKKNAGLEKDIKDINGEIVLQGQDIIKHKGTIDGLQGEVKQLTGDLKVARVKIVKMQGELNGHANNLGVAQGKIGDLEKLLDTRAKIDEAVKAFLKGQIIARKADKEQLENAIKARKAEEKKLTDGVGHLEQLAEEALDPIQKRHWQGDVADAKNQLANRQKTNAEENQKDNEDIEDLKVEIATAEQRLKDWDESVAKHAAAIKVQQDKITNLETHEAELLAALEKRNVKLKELEEVLTNKVKELKKQCELQLANLEKKLQGVIAGKDERIAEYEQSFKDSVIALDIIGKTYKGSLTEEIAQLVKGIGTKEVDQEKLQKHLEGLREKLNFAKKLQASFEELSKAAPELEPLQQKLLQTKEEIADLDKQIKAIETTEDGETQASGTLPVLIAKIKEMNERLAIAKMDLKDFTDNQKEVHAQAIRDAKDIEDKHKALQAKLGASEKDRKDTRTELDEQKAMLNKVRTGWEKNPGTVEGLDDVFDFLGELLDKDLKKATRGAKEAQTNLEKTIKDLEQADMDLTKSNHDIQNLVEDIGKLLNEPKEKGSDFSEKEKEKQLLAKFIDYFEKIKVQARLGMTRGKLIDDERKGSELVHTTNELEKKLKEGIERKQKEILALKDKVNSGDGQVAEKAAVIEKLNKEIATLEKEHIVVLNKKDKRILHLLGRENFELVLLANRYVGEVFTSKEEKFKKDLNEEMSDKTKAQVELQDEIDKTETEIKLLKRQHSTLKKQQDEQKGNVPPEEAPECDPTTQKDESSTEKEKLAGMEKSLAEKKEKFKELKVEIAAITGVLGAVEKAQEND